MLLGITLQLTQLQWVPASLPLVKNLNDAQRLVIRQFVTRLTRDAKNTKISHERLLNVKRNLWSRHENLNGYFDGVTSPNSSHRPLKRR